MARVLITGSNSGFGLLTAVSLAETGHHVVATMRNTAKGDDLRSRLDALGASFEIRQLDVTDPDSVAAAIHDPHDIDVVVNNAGYEVAGAVELLDDETMRHQFETNVLGPVRVIRAVLPAWRERRSGVVVNVSSVAGIVGTPYAGIYAASKHALEALSEALTLEVGQLGIGVKLVEPGRFVTGFHDNIVAVDGWERSEYFERAARFREASGRLGGDGPPADPQLVADAIVRAATDPDAPFRAFVGTDAELVSATKSSMSFEEFEATMRAALDWHD